MKLKYGKSRRKYKNVYSRRRIHRRKRNTISQLKNRFRNRKTHKLHGGVLMPFSETAGIFKNISDSVSNMVSTVVLQPTPTYNPLLPIDSRISSQFLNNVPTQNLHEILT
jgi:hypothetical protein